MLGENYNKIFIFIVDVVYLFVLAVFFLSIITASFRNARSLSSPLWSLLCQHSFVSNEDTPG